MSGPLEGIRVIDMGAAGVGPFACALLGDMGADVISILAPLDADTPMGPKPYIRGRSVNYIQNKASKRSMVLDRKHPMGKRAVFEICATADVVVQNLRAGVSERLGLVYGELAARNPGVVYVSVTGYGNKGPWEDMRAAEWWIQSFSGFANLNGEKDGLPEVLRWAHSDYNTSNTICQAVLMALVEREESGLGQRIDITMAQAMMYAQASKLAEYFATGQNPKRLGSASATLVPDQSFKTLDDYVNISVPREQFWPKLCQALTLEHLIHDPRFATNRDRIEHREELIPLLGTVLKDRPTWWWMYWLGKYDVPCAPRYLKMAEIVADHQVVANEMIAMVDHPHWGVVRHGGTPWKFSKTPAAVRPTALPGEHNEEILKEIGFEERGAIPDVEAIVAQARGR